MALIKYGGGIVQMSGSIAGNTYARNRYGNYCRARTKPTNPNTTRQQAVRDAVAFLVERWAAVLTSAQRAAWALYGTNVAMKNKLGESVKLSGINHYVRSNAHLARQGGTIVDAGPVIFELPEKDPTLGVTASEATQQLSVSFDDGFDWCSEDDAWMIIYQGQPQNPQRNFFNGPWRKIAQYAGNSGTPITSPQLSGVQFAISEGQRQWIYARILRADGRLSESMRVDCFVAA